MYSFCSLLYALIISFRTNSLLVETRVKSTLYTLILYWSGARHWVEEENIRRGPKKVAKFDEEVGGWQERKR